MAFDPSRYTGFEWDAGNIAKNAAKHDVSCREAEEIFFNQPLIIAPDPAHSQAEPRFRGLGRTSANRLLHLNFTVRGDKLRIISARPMNPPSMKRTTAKTAAPAVVARMPAAEAADFDWSAARPVSFPNLQPSSQTISLRMPLWMLHKLKTRANQRGVPYQAHLKEILADSLRD